MKPQLFRETYQENYKIYFYRFLFIRLGRNVLNKYKIEVVSTLIKGVEPVRFSIYCSSKKPLIRNLILLNILCLPIVICEYLYMIISLWAAVLFLFSGFYFIVEKYDKTDDRITRISALCMFIIYLMGVVSLLIICCH